MNAPAIPSSRNYWPQAIIAWFAIFITAMAAWIGFAVRQKMDLVRRDYYEEDLRYQQQLDRLNRSAALSIHASLRLDSANRQIVLQLPAAHAASGAAGRVQFYRPADAARDFEQPLRVGADGSQAIDASRLAAGLWKVRIQWEAAGQEYFAEQALVLPAAGPMAAEPSAERK